MEAIYVALSLVVGVVTLAYYWLKYVQNYWQRRGVPHNPPEILYGNSREFRKTQHITILFKEIYDKFRGQAPIAGFNFRIIPCSIALDIDLVKNILIKDFQIFDSRGIYYNEKDDPLTGNLFFMDGESWRTMRHKMTPVFTSGKMKNMFLTVREIGEELHNVFEEKIKESHDGVLEVNDLLSRYTADVIGRCAFGLECNSLRNPKAEFVEKGKMFFTTPRHSQAMEGFIFAFKDLARQLGIRYIHQEVHDFYMRIVQETIEYREKNQIKRNDFMDMMIEMKNSPNGLIFEEVAAQAFVFFIAGYETSSTTMTNVLYEMALNPDIQAKLRNDLIQVLAKHGNEFTYECMKDMCYLDQVIDESLRMHPVLGHLIRTANRRYEMGDPKYFIPANQMVVISVLGIHYNPEFYPEPHVFRPERFTKEAKEARLSCTYLPFGDGPRNCIGLRFGKMQASIGLAYLLKNFSFSVVKETEIPPPLSLKSFVMNLDHGVKLKVEKL